MNREGHAHNISDWDEASFKDFFTVHFASAVAHCMFQFNLDREEAREIVQQSFLRFWEARATILPALSPKAYLFTIAGNICRDRIRHLKTRSTHQRYLQSLDATSSANQLTELSVKELSLAIHRALESMPEKMRRIFEMSRYEGLKYAAIAAELNISVKTVETQMSRALEGMREHLAAFMSLEILFLAAVLLS